MHAPRLPQILATADFPLILLHQRRQRPHQLPQRLPQKAYPTKTPAMLSSREKLLVVFPFLSTSALKP